MAEVSYGEGDGRRRQLESQSADSWTEGCSGIALPGRFGATAACRSHRPACSGGVRSDRECARASRKNGGGPIIAYRAEPVSPGAPAGGSAKNVIPIRRPPVPWASGARAGAPVADPVLQSPAVAQAPAAAL